MTIIVAVRKDNEIVLAADSQTNWGSHRDQSDNVALPKLRRFGSNVIGSSGWALYDNILDHYLAKRKRMPPLNDERAIFSFFHRFWQDMRDRYTFVNDQCDDSTDSPFVDLDASFLIANSHGIFGVSGNMSVVRYKKYFAIGGAADYAMGALHALYDRIDEAEALALEAVDTAIRFNVYCGHPVDVERIKLKSRRRTR